MLLVPLAIEVNTFEDRSYEANTGVDLENVVVAAIYSSPSSVISISPYVSDQPIIEEV